MTALFTVRLLLVVIVTVIPLTVLCDESASYHVSIQNASSRTHRCNGVIYKDNYVLTSAKCISSATSRDLYVFYGSNTLDAAGSTVNVNRIFVHPSFNESLHWYDLAILEIRGAFNTPGVSLPERDVPLNESLVHSGWKITENTSNSLQSEQQMPISTKQCAQLYPSIANTLRSWQICASAASENTRCNDQELGSALTAANGEIYGILSSCNEKPLQIFTNIYKLRDYIQFQTGDSPV